MWQYDAWMNMVFLIKETYEKGLFGDWKKEHFKKAQKLSSSIEEHAKQLQCQICNSFFDGGRVTCSRSCATTLSNLSRKEIDWKNINILELLKTKTLEELSQELGCGKATILNNINKFKY